MDTLKDCKETVSATPSSHGAIFALTLPFPCHVGDVSASIGDSLMEPVRSVVCRKQTVPNLCTQVKVSEVAPYFLYSTLHNGNL